ncbi:MAG: hypothetical protein KF878_33215 [Planctomycetes bacterium]|nr:hypothetical protein [Planctomycetota bacterium]
MNDQTRPDRRGRRRGSALTLTLVVGMLLIAIAAASVGITHSQAQGVRGDREAFMARINAQSGINEALSRLRFTLVPVSGTGSTPTWSRLGDGGFYYRTTSSGATVRITCWGRVRNDARRSAGEQVALEQPTLAPDDPTFVSRGWTIRGMEAVIHRTKHFPNAPLYVGNGGVEKGRGGFAWNDNADPSDPSTWTYLPTNSNTGIDSWMARQFQLRVDARDHAVGFLSGQGFPTGDPHAGLLQRPVQTPHPYSLFASQNQVGQHNAKSFFQPWTSGSSTFDPRPHQVPNPASTTAYPNANDAFQLDNQLPDVQEFAWALWQAYGGQPGTVTIPANNANLGVSSSVLEVGTASDPKVAFTTGNLNIGENRTLRGHGILIIRDNYHPVLGPFNNTPSGNTNQAKLIVSGNLEWTGLVILAGWAPSVDTKGMTTGKQVRINGAFFGEDSVQSGGETSLDSAQIQFYLGPSIDSTESRGFFRLTYCRSLFEPGGFVYNFMPELRRDLVFIRDL